MKSDFSQILIPKGKSDTVSLQSSENTSFPKVLLTISLLATVITTLLISGFIVRYETKLVTYENRISELELQLENFLIRLEEQELLEYETNWYDSEPIDYNDFWMEVKESEEKDNEDSQSSSVSNEQDSVFGKVELEKKDTVSRKKRQIPYPQLPTFGPEVERTKDGVPIVEESYLTSIGVTLKPRLRTTTDDTPAGLRLYDELIENRERTLPRNRKQSQIKPVLPHHQISAAWTDTTTESNKENDRESSRIELKSGDSLTFDNSNTHAVPDSSYKPRRHSSYRQSSLAANGYPRSHRSGNSNSHVFSSGGAGGTYHRNSRVPATGDYFYPTSSSRSTSRTRSIQYPHLRKLPADDGEVIARVLQSDSGDIDAENQDDSREKLATASANSGQSATAEASSRRVRMGRRRHSNRPYSQNHRQNTQLTEPEVVSSVRTFSTQYGDREWRKYQNQHQQSGEIESDEITILKADAWVESPSPVVAHFVADASNYTLAHKHYEGNGRLRNVDGIFSAWKPADWMSSPKNHENKNFLLLPNGVVTVKVPGLYYIYAQIHYLDEHDINGYTVQVNRKPFLQCTSMTETQNSNAKSNSCFTAGVTELKKNDRILIRDVETNRYSIFLPEKSFFGLMKLGLY